MKNKPLSATSERVAPSPITHREAIPRGRPLERPHAEKTPSL